MVMDSRNYKSKDFDCYQNDRENRESVLLKDDDEEMLDEQPEIVEEIKSQEEQNEIIFENLQYENIENTPTYKQTKLFFEGVFEADETELFEIQKNIEWLMPDTQELEILKNN
jgi:predicted AAA+ superfamily ATPase